MRRRRSHLDARVGEEAQHALAFILMRKISEAQNPRWGESRAAHLGGVHTALKLQALMVDIARRGTPWLDAYSHYWVRPRATRGVPHLCVCIYVASSDFTSPLRCASAIQQPARTPFRTTTKYDRLGRSSRGTVWLGFTRYCYDSASDEVPF